MKTILAFLIVLLILTASSVAIEEVPVLNKTDISNQVKSIVDYINKGDTDSLNKLISPNARVGLKEEIASSLEKEKTHFGITLQESGIYFEETINSFENIGGNKVKVKGRYYARGFGYTVEGPNYFTFEKFEDSWLLVDTDFHKKIGSGDVVGMIVKLFAIVIPIMLISGAFWLWMLIDCVKREFDDKLKWVILILVLNILGAIFYFFKVRRKLKQQEKMR